MDFARVVLVIHLRLVALTFNGGFVKDEILNLNLCPVEL